MKELKPFGDVPDMLSLQIKRSFIATRKYAQALASAAEAARNMINVSVLCRRGGAALICQPSTSARCFH